MIQFFFPLLHLPDQIFLSHFHSRGVLGVADFKSEVNFHVGGTVFPPKNNLPIMNPKKVISVTISIFSFMAVSNLKPVSTLEDFLWLP